VTPAKETEKRAGGDTSVAAPRRRLAASIPVRTVAGSAGWFVTGVLALLAAGRLAHLDDAIGWPYTGINAFTSLIYLPAYAALAIAFAFRRNPLMIFSGLVIAFHLLSVVPEILPGNPEQAPAGAARIRLLTSNLRYDNNQAGRLGAQITDQHPDIVVLAEVSPLTLDRVRSSGALGGYPYRAVYPADGAFGAAVFSRFPLSEPAAPRVDGVLPLRVTVTVDDRRRFVLYAVHTISPTRSDYARRWRREIDALRTEVKRATLPVVMAGDFNATRDHRPFRRLLDAGMRDAHDVVGAGWTPTWKANSLLLPPVLRIDHVLASPAFAVTGYRVGAEIGSDHKPVLADLAFSDR
jgi:endonuclease/exonuclease/phosphatase (EEP) superfamily protein YafD